LNPPVAERSVQDRAAGRAADAVTGRANALDRDGFVAAFGALYEDSPWVAAAVYDRRPFESRDDLLAAMSAAVREAPRERQIALIRAHPDLAGRAAVAGELSEDSAREQAAAGLDRLTPAEHAELTAANAAYRERFGFPFVICAREHGKAEIIAAVRERLGHDPEREVATALHEIDRIAALRLQDLP
jgi:OHCU decarboxylase